MAFSLENSVSKGRIILISLVLSGFSLLLCVLASLAPSFKEVYSVVLYSQEGKLLGASIADDGQWRFPPTGKLPGKFVKAIITFEDKRFFTHFGIDLLAVGRAAIQNLKTGRVVSGGSTITMQTVRLVLGNQNRTFTQKLKESFLALLLEFTNSKAGILEIYACNAPFGGNVVGIEAASWRYFGRGPENLTWAQTATLAVLPNQPSLVHPGGDRKKLRQKRDRLLQRLFENGDFDRRTLHLALAEPLPGQVLPLPSLAPHFFQREKMKLLAKTGSGGIIRSSLRYDLQRLVNAKLDQWGNLFINQGIHNGAVLVVDTESSQILAYAGNIGFGTENNAVDMVKAQRSSGSLLKPFLYGAQLDAGQLLPKRLVVDIPTRMGSYKPENNLPQYMGVVPADEALTKSLNVPAVRALRDYGVEPFLRLLKRLGFTTFWRRAEAYGLPLVLGGGEVTLEETVEAYAGLMRTAAGMKLKEKKSFPLSQGAAWLTLEALVKGIRPVEEVSWQLFASAKRVAWKTGTSFGSRDCWAIGVTPLYTVGVWVGNASGEGRPELRSATTAAPLLFDVFSILETASWSQKSENVTTETVCAYSGYLAGQFCAKTSEDFRPKDAISSVVCPYCHMVSLTPDKKYQASAQDLTGIYAGTFPVTEKRFVLPPALEHYYTSFNLNYRGLPPKLPGSGQKSFADDLSIVFPETGSKMYIPIELDGTPGQVVMEVFHRNRGGTVYWDLDGEYVGRTRHIHQMEMRPLTGAHVLTVTDEAGNQAAVTFEIL